MDPKDAEAKNLEAITKAIVQHNGNCGDRILRIEMCAYEVERLGWEEIRGIPVVATDTLPEGRFRLVCERMEPQGEDPSGSIGEVAEGEEFVTVGGDPERREL